MEATEPYGFEVPGDTDDPDGPDQLGKLIAKLNAVEWLSANLKPTRGLVKPSGDLSILGVTSFTDVPGTEKKLTVAVKSILVVRAVFEFFSNDNTPSFGGDGEGTGTVSVDGVTTIGGRAYHRNGFDDEVQVDTRQGFVLDERTIEPGEHTIKLRAKGKAGTQWDTHRVEADGTLYEYEVWAA